MSNPHSNTVAVTSQVVLFVWCFAYLLDAAGAYRTWKIPTVAVGVCLMTASLGFFGYALYMACAIRPRRDAEGDEEEDETEHEDEDADEEKTVEPHQQADDILSAAGAMSVPSKTGASSPINSILCGPPILEEPLATAIARLAREQLSEKDPSKVLELAERMLALADGESAGAPSAPRAPALGLPSCAYLWE